MVIAWLALVVAVVGALTYGLASNAKVAELGRILFFCGVFLALMAAGAKTTVRLP